MISFNRLRRSWMYDAVIHIYAISGEQEFYGRQVGLKHSVIGVLR